MECGGQSCGECADSPGASSTQSVSRANSSRRVSANASAWWQAKVCCKCKEAPAQVAANQTEALCASCLNASLFSKFKTAINTHDPLLTSHKVLLAFSGGPSSRVALEYFLEIREKAQRDASHCSDGNSKVFGFGVVHVDESSILSITPSESATIDKELRSIVMERERKPDEFLSILLESVYSDAELDAAGPYCDEPSTSKRQRLQMLFKHVADSTGKEDLLEHLRMQALQQTAKNHGYTRLVLGLSTSRIAAKVISETAKGSGFSLPAGMQYYDARWSVPVVLPLRDCIAKELVSLCHFRKLKWVFIPSLSTLSPQRTINSLSASFVSVLQQDNPSRERTIMCTAAKLQPFSFNHKASWEASGVQKRGTRANGIPTVEDITVESLCLVCCAPLNPQDSCSKSQSFEVLEAMRGRPENSCCTDSSVASATAFIEKCCLGCQYEIFEGNQPDDTHKLLPLSMKKSEMVNPKITEMWMRSQIRDCLLSDSEAED